MVWWPPKQITMLKKGINMPKAPPAPLFILAVLLLVFVVINFCIMQLPVEVATDLVREGHLIELVTVIEYFVAVLLLLWKGFKENAESLSLSAIMVLLLALRELDYHEKFTTMGIFKTKFYVSPEVPVLEKSIVSVIVVLLILFVYYYLKKYTGPFWVELKKKNASAIFTAIGIGTMFFSKFLDSCSDYIEEIVINFYDEPVLFSRMIEETAEMIIPILFILAALYYNPRKPQAAGTHFSTPFRGISD